MDYTGFRPQASDDGEPPLSLDRLLVRPYVFFAVMHGHAMARAGIRAKDLLVIEPQEQYRDKQIVLALVDQQALVRRLERAGVGFQLVAAHPRIEPIEVGEDCVIRGRVIATITLLAVPRVPLPVVS